MYLSLDVEPDLCLEPIKERISQSESKRCPTKSNRQNMRV